MGSFTFKAPPPDTRAYVTGVCSKPTGSCEMERYFPRRNGKPERLTRLAADAFCGCGAPLVNLRHLKSARS